MPNTDDMSKPVTHAELREGLAELRATLAEGFAENRTLILAEVAQIVAREVAREAAHAVKSTEENLRSYMGAMLDKASADDARLDAKYSDLPPRVGRLEAAVFPPKRQRRR